MREHSAQIAAVAAVHIVDVIIVFQILAGDLTGPVIAAGHIMLQKFSAGRRIDTATDLFPAGCAGINLKPVSNTGLRGHIFQYKLRHGTSANIAMAYE